jgi:hypothetical protein
MAESYKPGEGNVVLVLDAEEAGFLLHLLRAGVGGSLVNTYAPLARVGVALMRAGVKRRYPVEKHGEHGHVVYDYPGDVSTCSMTERERDIYRTAPSLAFEAREARLGHRATWQGDC